MVYIFRRFGRVAIVPLASSTETAKYKDDIIIASTLSTQRISNYRGYNGSRKHPQLLKGYPDPTGTGILRRVFDISEYSIPETLNPPAFSTYRFISPVLGRFSVNFRLSPKSAGISLSIQHRRGCVLSRHWGLKDICIRAR